MDEKQPIKIKRVTPTSFVINCDNEVQGDIAESLLKRLSQFPAEFEKEEKNISVVGE